MKPTYEEIKKIIRPYMIKRGENENQTIILIQELIAKWFLYGIIIGLFFGILMSQL